MTIKALLATMLLGTALAMPAIADEPAKLTDAELDDVTAGRHTAGTTSGAWYTRIGEGGFYTRIGEGGFYTRIGEGGFYTPPEDG